ncbi:MAG: hypothetical protein HUJ86_03900 [Synergistes sp.]|nr:hypothetical protein [Synergistes sp.]
MRDLVQTFLDAPIPAEMTDINALLDRLRVPRNERNMRAAYIANVLLQALDPKGIKWAELLVKLSGETPADKKEITGKDDEPLPPAPTIDISKMSPEERDAFIDKLYRDEK